MNPITRRIHAAIEHHRVEKDFRRELKKAELARFHREMTDHSNPFLTMYRILDGTEQPKIFSIYATLERKLMDQRLASRLLEYNGLISERAAAHREIDAKYKPAEAPAPDLS